MIDGVILDHPVNWSKAKRISDSRQVPIIFVNGKDMTLEHRIQNAIFERTAEPHVMINLPDRSFSLNADKVVNIHNKKQVEDAIFSVIRGAVYVKRSY